MADEMQRSADSLRQQRNDARTPMRRMGHAIRRAPGAGSGHGIRFSSPRAWAGAAAEEMAAASMKAHDAAGAMAIIIRR